MAETTNSALPRRFGFLLVDDFTLISMASAIEPLRMANRITGTDLFSWKTISESGAAVSASAGISVNANAGFEDPSTLTDVQAIIVCGGRRVENNVTDSMLRWLRGVGQRGIGLGATCTGSHILAAAGLLDGYRCSVHWENMGALANQFKNVYVSQNIFTIDRDRYTSSGGTAPVDMMLQIIAAHCGSGVAAGVADQFIHERMRRADDTQRVPLRHLVGNQSAKLIMAVELMEANIREPIGQADLAEYVGLSRRQLQRLFHRYLMCTPSRYYLQVRLKRARELLHQTNKNLVEISALTGFVSSSHFSKTYKEHYGRSPSAERRQ